MIGINSQIATGGSSGSVGIGFAVPVNTAKAIVPELKEDGEVERAFLGVTTATSPSSKPRTSTCRATRARWYRTSSTAARPTRPASRRAAPRRARALTVGGDLIVEVDGQEIERSPDVAAAIADRKPGDKVRSSTSAATSAGR